MWQWTLNWGRVREDLIVGSCPLTAADIDAIHAGTGVSALLSVQCDDCRAGLGIDLEGQRRHAERRGLAFVNAPMRDFDLADQRRRLAASVSSLAGLLQARHKVYIHCTAGINRAPLTVLGLLTFVEGMRPDAALKMLRAGRPEAEPYLEAWHGCRIDLVERHREAIATRASELSQRDPGATSEEHWQRAEAAVIREILLAGDVEV